jgi:hypothetical protein
MSWFKKNSPVSSAPPVSVQFDQSCYTLLLNHVNDEHTNAEALWQKKFTAYPKICEKNTQNEHYRLQTALDKNTAQIYCYNEKLKRTRPEAFVYSDVLVWLPQTVVDKELRQNTGALNSLTSNLSVLHQDRFKAQLLHKRPPHYALLGSNLLQNDEVAFQFGFGIYVAAPPERAVLQFEAIYTDEQGVAHSFMPQVSYQVDSKTAGHVIYPEQQNVIISQPADHLCCHLPYKRWFSELCSHIQLQRTKEQWQAFASSGSAGSIKIDSQFKESAWHFTFFDTTILSDNGNIPALLLILKPLGQPNPTFRPRIVEDNSPTAATSVTTASSAAGNQAISQHQAWGATVIPDLNQGQSYKTIIPGSQSEPLLIVEGLALPRIDNAQGRVQGLKQWTIWFDAAGNIVDGNNSLDRHPCMAVSANQQHAVAYFKNVGQNFVPLTVDSHLSLGGRAAILLPSPMPERFHALIKLTHPIQFVLQPMISYTIGRQSADATPEIDLTLLNDPLGMAWENGSPYAGSVLSMLSLSRNHVSFSLEQEQLQLNVPANKQPVYLLNADLSLKETLHSSQYSSEAVLVANQYLLLGCFLLRFSV